MYSTHSHAATMHMHMHASTVHSSYQKQKAYSTLSVNRCKHLDKYQLNTAPAFIVTASLHSLLSSSNCIHLFVQVFAAKILKKI